MKRITRKSILIFTEGLADKNFVNSLRNTIQAKTGFRIQVKSGTGGCPNTVVKQACKIKSNSGFDFCFVLIDDDIVVQEATKKLAKDNTINIIKSQPICIEGMLLKYIGVRKVPNTASKCKKLLAEKYKAPYKYQTPEYFNDIVTRINQGGPSDIEPLVALISVLNCTHHKLSN